MSYIKFSIVFVLSFNIFANSIFTAKECVNSNFELKTEHGGKYFGLVRNELKIKKNECVVEIEFQKILAKTWNIDFCREPIHIKVSDKGGISVVKKLIECDNSQNASKDDFCQEVKNILTILQDEGLIFAKGKKEKLSDQHGQVYCTYMLLKKYLIHSKIFSSYADNVDLFEGESLGQKNTNCEIIKIEQNKAPAPEVKTEASDSF